MSKLDQLNQRPATHTLTTRLDARYLATLIRYWHKQNLLPRSSSELIRLSIETFTEVLLQSNEIGFVDRHSDALEILNSTGMKTKVNPRNLAKALVNESLNLSSSAPPIDAGYQKTRKDNPISTFEATAIEAEVAKRLEETQETDSQVKEALDGPPNPKETSS